jgi:acyl-CoA thioesterase
MQLTMIGVSMIRFQIETNVRSKKKKKHKNVRSKKKKKHKNVRSKKKKKHENVRSKKKTKKPNNVCLIEHFFVYLYQQ